MSSQFFAGRAAKCSVCGKPIDVHQQIRGGTCDQTSCRTKALHRAMARRKAEEKAAQELVARAHLPTLLSGRSEREADPALLVIPGSVAALQPVPAERRENLRESLAQAVAASVDLESPETPAQLVAVESEAPSPAVAAACTTCRGFCCRTGADRAYIDASTVSRVRAGRSELDDDALVALYLDAVPEQSVEHSCIYHGEHGCALPRELRSQTCNVYFCPPMHAWLGQRATQVTPLTAVFVLHENRVVRSRLIEEEATANTPG